MSRLSIIVTGSHGVGKTTLIQKIVEKYRFEFDIVQIPETARQLVELGFQVNDKISRDGILKYCEIYKSNKVIKKADIMISDRAIFDLYVYTQNLFPSRFDRELEKFLRTQVMLEVMETSKFVYVPIEFPMANDGIRPEDTDYQYQIDSIIKRLFDEFKIAPITVSGTINERIAIFQKLFKI